MKNFIPVILLISASLPSFAAAELCADGSKSGSESCNFIEEVLIKGEWLAACCDNVKPPEGYSCVTDDCDAETYESSIPELTRKNAYILFAQGYRAWTIINGEAHDRVYGIYKHSFNLETIREYLPMAREFFLDNPKLEMFSLIHDEDMTIVIQRPENEENLQEEIVFPNKVSGQELENFLKKFDEQGLSIYPNPITDHAIIRFENNLWISKVDIMSTDGKLVKHVEYAEAIPEVETDIKDVEAGNYYLRIVDKMGREFSKQIQVE